MKGVLLFLFCCFGLHAANQRPMTADESKSWLQEALHYGFDLATTDYTKYMSEKYVEHLNGKVFNFQQWTHHMASLKNMMKSYSLTFDEILAEGDRIASSYVVHAVQKDGIKLDVRIIAIFKIKDQKMIYCDELAYVLNGPESESNLPSED